MNPWAMNPFADDESDYTDPFAGDFAEANPAPIDRMIDFLSLRAWASQPMSEGNAKLDKRVLIFNLPPIKSCPNSASCRDSCYAVPFYRQYPDVWERYDANFKLAKEEPLILAYMIGNQIEAKLKTRGGIVAVRVHSSGDFYSQEYIDMWEQIAKRFTKVNFYAYTKADKVLDMKPLDALPNFNVIRSFIAGKWRNYGTPEYVAKVKAANPDAFICPAIHNKKVHCGGECNYCIKGKKPLFYIHGTMKKAGTLKEREYGADYWKVWMKRKKG